MNALYHQLAPWHRAVRSYTRPKRSRKTYLAEFACWMILVVPLSYLLYLNLIGAL